MSDRGRFEFFDEWRLATGPDAVWPVIRDVERLAGLVAVGA